jgi:hypothetical protein
VEFITWKALSLSWGKIVINVTLNRKVKTFHPPPPLYPGAITCTFGSRMWMGDTHARAHRHAGSRTAMSVYNRTDNSRALFAYLMTSVAETVSRLCLGNKRKRYSFKRSWRPTGLWDVEAPTSSRQSAHRWPWDCQPYTPAALYPPEKFLVLISVRGRVDAMATARQEGLCQLKNPVT